MQKKTLTYLKQHEFLTLHARLFNQTIYRQNAVYNYILGIFSRNAQCHTKSFHFFLLRRDRFWISG